MTGKITSGGSILVDLSGFCLQTSPCVQGETIRGGDEKNWIGELTGVNVCDNAIACCYTSVFGREERDQNYRERQGSAASSSKKGGAALVASLCWCN